MSADRISEDNRIYIRKITRKDTDLIVDWRNRDEVRRNFFYREEFTRQIHEKWLEEQVDTGRVEQFIVCMKVRDGHYLPRQSPARTYSAQTAHICLYARPCRVPGPVSLWDLYPAPTLRHGSCSHYLLNQNKNPFCSYR